MDRVGTTELVLSGRLPCPWTPARTGKLGGDAQAARRAGHPATGGLGRYRHPVSPEPIGVNKRETPAKDVATM